jgi:ribosomal protein S18 acetylase RimI-like enzyme
MANNFERMLELVNRFFDTRNDPDQISVDEEERELLAQIHPATMSELVNEDGPIVWILLVPTTTAVMGQFLKGAISEKQLLFDTPAGRAYDAIYLCSASVLPEFRHKGLAKKVTIEAINKIRNDHAINALFYWPFSEEGRLLAMSIATETGLPIYERKS